MTPAEYKSARATLGLSHDDLAAWLGVNRASSYKWEGGVNEVPGPVARAVGLASEMVLLGGIHYLGRDWIARDHIAPLIAVREGQ